MKGFIQMKKIIMLLCLGLIICLTGCGKSNNNNNKNIIEIVKVIEFQNNEMLIDGYELRNLTNKTITAFKGHIMFCDKFGDTIAKKPIHISDTLPPHSSIAYCYMVNRHGKVNFKGSSLDNLDGFPMSLAIIPGKDISKAKIEISKIKYSN